MSNIDPTEEIRRAGVESIGRAVAAMPDPRKTLEDLHGKDNVWDGYQLAEQFEVIGFLAPLVIVKRKSDGVKGTMYFSHRPRLYFGFMPEDK